jgi:hypothetical protein
MCVLKQQTPGPDPDLTVMDRLAASKRGLVRNSNSFNRLLGYES